MKLLLGWMHRKFRENNNETLKDLSIGLTGKLSTDDRQYYPRDVNSSKYLGKAHFSRPFTRLDAVVKAEEDFEETPTELFHGFLAIGTLGAESITKDSATPTSLISVENIDEKETEVKEDELELNNDEPEKIISNEAENEIFSGKTTHENTGTVNQCSDISLGGQPAVSDGTGGIVCPEQNCRSVSVMEETGGALSSMRQKHRTSLEELLWKTKQAEENCGIIPEMEGKQKTGKQVDNCAVHLMKKFLKLTSISTTSTATSGSAKGKKKLRKVRKHVKHIFSRKVHPENSFSGHQDYKTGKKEIKNKDPFIEVPDFADIEPSADDIIIYPEGVFSNHGSWSGSESHFPLLLKESGDAFVNEIWIKSDDDYLVLELQHLE